MKEIFALFIQEEHRQSQKFICDLKEIFGENQLNPTLSHMVSVDSFSTFINKNIPFYTFLCL
jgi:hypothetical protein